MRADLRLWLVFLKSTRDGISLNRIVFRQPTPQSYSTATYEYGYAHPVNSRSTTPQLPDPAGAPATTQVVCSTPQIEHGGLSILLPMQASTTYPEYTLCATPFTTRCHNTTNFITIFPSSHLNPKLGRPMLGRDQLLQQSGPRETRLTRPLSLPTSTKCPSPRSKTTKAGRRTHRNHRTTPTVSVLAAKDDSSTSFASEPKSASSTSVFGRPLPASNPPLPMAANP